MFDDVFLANALFVLSLVLSLFPYYTASFKSRSGIDKFSIFWYSLTSLIHIVFESYYIYMAFTADPINGIQDSKVFMGAFWREYGKADARYGRTSDMEVFSIEVMAVFVFTPLALINLVCVLRELPSRHFFQVFLSGPHALGTYFYLYPEILRGSPNLNWADPIYKYYYIYFTNGLWIVIPLMLAFHSYTQISKMRLPATTKPHQK